MNKGMKIQDILMDRTFDAACLTKKNEEEWANQIITRLLVNHPEQKEYINNLYEFYLNMVEQNTDFLVRADYMIENKNKLRLRF